MCSSALRVSRTCRQRSDTKRDYKHVFVLRQKMGKYQKKAIGKISLILKIILPVTAKCCLFHDVLSWEKHQKGKKLHRSLMSAITAKVTMH